MATAGLFAAAAPSAAQTYMMGKAIRYGTRVDSTVSISVRRLAPGVYAAKVNYVWAGWVEIGDGILMVDAGFNDESAKALADTVRARSGARPFRYVVNTHQHEDHAGGDRYFASLGATIVAQESVADEVQALLAPPPGGSADSSAAAGTLAGTQLRAHAEAKSAPEAPARVKRIKKRASFGGPKRPVEVLWLGKPAHTAGDLVVYLPKQRVLFAGDIASDRSVPWLLDPGMDVDGWLHSLDSLLTKAFTIDSLVPGHGEMRKPINAIQFTHHYLTDTREKATDNAAWGTSLKQVRDWGYLGSYEGLEFYEDTHFMNVRRLYNEAKGIKTPGRRNVRAIKRT
ncbi:MAG: MBL fold metallo-hydrolase [Candidatus Latescibacteria bacterium]|nr:MBL fold metallo-hydrolase [Candidatus Latescibacterota bacterium]